MSISPVLPAPFQKCAGNEPFFNLRGILFDNETHGYPRVNPDIDTKLPNLDTSKYN